jgi:nitrous oxidase accessory protein NosD
VFGFNVVGNGATVRGNLALRNREGAFYINGSRHHVADNVAMDNRLGFFLRGSGQHITTSVASGNRVEGIRAEGHDHVISDNVVSGNGTGIHFGGERHRVYGNVIAGNTAAGIEAYGRGEATRNDIYGNGTGGKDGFENCGILTGAQADVTATANYWGHPSGPGSNPADAVCLQPGGAMRVVPFSAVELGPRAQEPVNVANNGYDSPTCGTPAEPCRSINRAIANQPSLTTFIVGPGRYGDLDGGGGWYAGEEYEVGLTRPSLVLQSRNGAGATVIAGSLVANYDAANGRIGGPQAGFAVLGTVDGSGLSTFAKAHVEGNVVLGRDVATFGDAVTLKGNLVVDARGSAIFAQSPGERLTGNLALANDTGIEIVSNAVQASSNVVAGNRFSGIESSIDDIVLRDNIIGGNERGIFLPEGRQHIVRGNVVAGNRRAGIFTEADRATITNNDIYGNNETPDDWDAGRTNCGITFRWPWLVEGNSNFWGSAAGPGSNPSDEWCGATPLSTYRPTPLERHAPPTPFREPKRTCPAGIGN